VSIDTNLSFSRTELAGADQWDSIWTH
jgi:hypothetical protein